MPADITAVVLAAGNSRRFGCDKRQALMPDGKTVLEHSLKILHDHVQSIVLAVRTSEPWLENTIKDYNKVTLLTVANSKGMGDTLAAAARFIADTENENYILITLADMPWLRPETIHNIANAPLENHIVIPAYRQQWGHPVRFHRKYLTELQNCSGDSGARNLLLRESSSRTVLEIDDPGIIRDIDLPADLE